jgi:hypothetical protein
MDSKIIVIKENEFVKISITEWLPFSKMSRAEMRTVYQYASFNLNLSEGEIKELNERYNFRLTDVDLKEHDVGFVLELQLSESGKKVFHATNHLESQKEIRVITIEGLLSLFPSDETINSQQIDEGHYKARFYNLDEALICFNEKIKEFNMYSNRLRKDLSEVIKELRAEVPRQREKILELQELSSKLIRNKLE